MHFNAAESEQTVKCQTFKDSNKLTDRQITECTSMPQSLSRQSNVKLSKTQINSQVERRGIPFSCFFGHIEFCNWYKVHVFRCPGIPFNIAVE